MDKILFTGVCTALVTPFLDGKVNYPMMEMLLLRQIEAGIQAVIIAGTTGEGATLTDDEKLELVARCKDYAKDRLCIIAGTGSNCTAHAAALSQEAERASADALLVVSPYYNKATEDGLVAHYMTIAHSVSIPVILYNVPSRTGMDMPVNVYRRLSAVENIVGVKEASVDMEKLLQIRVNCSNRFSVWSGNDALTVPAMALGAKGVISVASNVIPMQMKQMTDFALSGNFTAAARLQAQLYPLTQALFREVNPVGIKAFMKLSGFDCGHCRLPLTTPQKDTIEVLKNCIM